MLKLFQLLSEAIPEPKTELVYHNHFELLIAVMLSAQATDISVNKATVKIFPQHNTPEALLVLGEKKLFESVRHIGLAPTKTKNVLATCKLLIEKHQSQVPHTRKELESLPGVGRKTANVLLNTLFDEPQIAVDTHVFRVAKRMGMATGKTPLEVEKELLQNTPKKYLKTAHHLLILHGRYTCKAKKPHCLECAVQSLCPSYEEHHA